MSTYRDSYDQASKAYDDARFGAMDAKALVGSAAVDIAEQGLETGTADATVLAVYEKAKVLAGQKIAEAKEAWAVYDRAYRIWTGQEKEKPPAVAAAEGEETKNQR